ncbi:hypothetical protein NZK35_28910 [Stieleria sp. ICT_E10.1]|uniref:hypothetical protein n=1 Tax=Stieleria sedimenti TaxID=2976331 RepID=UPI0021803EAD|nr:hypothetical protein [Stieleria sedimenti]MCS7470692.1 hypothetical protein [Stieleria sedimenti]
MTKDPFAVPDDEPNPFAIQRPAAADAALNPYAPTSHVSETEGFESDVESFRRRYLSHEASIKSIGFLYLIPGVLLLVFFVAMLGVAAVSLLVDGNGMQGMGLVEAALVVGIYGGLGSVQIYTGLGLRRFKIAARRLATVFSVIGLLMFPFGTLINGYILYLLQSQKGKVVFSESYQDAIRRTPHIKYQTSLIVKVLVVILFAVIGLGITAMFFGT